VEDDPTIQWRLATPFGIEVNAETNAWYSGHINDVLPFPDLSAILVASETGGVWLLDGAGTSLALSDPWDCPDVKCLALGPDGPRHVFAGCTVAYDSASKRAYQPEAGSGPVIMESDAAALAPMLSWSPVDSPLPAGAGRITRIVVIGHLRRVIVSCAAVRGGDSGGLFWASIPPTRFAAGDPPRAPFVWNEAKVAGAPSSGFWDLTLAATRDDVARENLEDRTAIVLVAGGFQSGGVFVGQWDAADMLVFERAHVHFDSGVDATSLLFDSCGTTSVSSCAVGPNSVYAACAWPDGRLNCLLSSRDGGRNWVICPAGIAGQDPGKLLAPTVGDQGADWNNCIAAHPADRAMAALGWQAGTYLTRDAGATWQGVVDSGGHLHDDVHALSFLIETPGTIGGLFVGSDGGVAKINLDDLPGVNGPAIRSDFNRTLPTLQCYSNLVRQFVGTIDISSELSGILAAGVQDNGNLSARFRPTPGPWRSVDGGDGGWNASVVGGYIHNVKGEATIGAAPLSPDVQVAVLPVTVPPPPNTAGLAATYGEPVMTPSHRNSAGRLLLAAAAANGESTVYGLYDDLGPAPALHWERMGAIASDDTATAFASFNGDTIHVGSGSGRMYAVDPDTGASTEQVVKLPQPNPSTRMKGGIILRIVGFDAQTMFALLIGAVETKLDGSAVLGTPAVQGYILKLEGNVWTPTAGAGLPNMFVYGLVAVAASNTRVERGLLAATDDAVYISRDDGKSWNRASAGLPRRPHCGDLRFALDTLGEANIALGTFGRSVWLAKLN
jgi:hypothetical protein